MSATTTAAPESTNSSSYSVSSHNGSRQKSRIGNLTAAQAKAFLRKGVQNVHVDPNTTSPPPAYSTAASYEPQREQEDYDSAGSQATHLLQQEAGHAGGFIEDDQMALAFDNHHDPRADTPFSSPEITPPADGSRRKPRSVSGPPTSMPMGMKERPGPEPDSAECECWSVLNQITPCKLIHCSFPHLRGQAHQQMRPDQHQRSLQQSSAARTNYPFACGNRSHRNAYSTRQLQDQV